MTVDGWVTSAGWVTSSVSWDAPGAFEAKACQRAVLFHCGSDGERFSVSLRVVRGGVWESLDPPTWPFAAYGLHLFSENISMP